MTRKTMMVAMLVAVLPCLADWGKGPNGTFWNGWSPWFIQAPTLGFKVADGAKSYRFEVTDDFHRRMVLTSDKAEVSLDGLWDKLPVGYVTVVCRGVGASGEDRGEIGSRTFWKKAAYDGTYAPRAMSFGKAKFRILDNFLDLPQIRYLREHGKIDRRYYLSGYPTKMLAAEIEAFVTVCRGLDDNENNKARKEDLIDLSRKAADILIAGSFPAGSVLEHFPVTYDKDGCEYGRFRDQQDWVMLVYPPQAGIAYVRLYGVTKDAKYLEAAERIAATFMKTQGVDGTWPLRMNARTGETIGKSRLLPFETMQMFEELYAVTGKKVYRETSDRAFAFVEKTVEPGWCWEGQFEDGRVIDDGYENLSNFPANQMIMHILDRYPGDAKRIEQAEKIMSFVEDQFIHWRPPYDNGRHPEDVGEDDGTWAWWCHPYSNWMTPCAVEQYICCVPVDASAAKCIRALLAVYRATGKRIYLEKARALGATQTRMVEEDGFINTWTVKGAKRNDDRYHTWENCTVEIMNALGMLAELEGK